jgi:hypothetical protein
MFLKGNGENDPKNYVMQEGHYRISVRVWEASDLIPRWAKKRGQWQRRSLLHCDRRQSISDNPPQEADPFASLGQTV